MRPEIIKLLEENISSKVLDVSLSNNFFFDLPPKAMATKNKRNYTKLISVQQREKLSNKKAATEREKIFANYIFNQIRSDQSLSHVRLFATP